MSQKAGLKKGNGKKELNKNARASSMSNKSAKGGKKQTGKDKDAGQQIKKEFFNAADMSSGLLMADEFIEKIFGKVDGIITVNETVKKLPDYNANLTVEQILWI